MEGTVLERIRIQVLEQRWIGDEVVVGARGFRVFLSECRSKCQENN
jgi:hypothetical protein